MRTSVKGGDLPGLKALMQRMAEANKSVLVGVPAGEFEESPGKEAIPMAMVAAVHEFGCPERNIPERSFLRGGIRRGTPKFHAVNVDSMKKVLRGDMTIDGSLEKLGVVAVGEVKREFTAATFEPLKPSTIARRMAKISPKRIAAHKAKLEAGENPGLLFRPLVDTGSLRQSITYQLEGTESANAKVVR